MIKGRGTHEFLLLVVGMCRAQARARAGARTNSCCWLWEALRPATCRVKGKQALSLKGVAARRRGLTSNR
jgi:hypothetical protein